MEMGWYIAVCVMVLCVTRALGGSPECPPSCKCSDVPMCPPGSVPVPDSCGCGCTVCAQGLGFGCDGFRPCDASQNLVCDYEDGVCKVRQESSRSCFHDGNEIPHGEKFEIDCHSYCKCKDGNIACAPLCPEPERPIIPNCKDMQLVTAPGECCAQWRCLDDLSGSEDWEEPDDIYPGSDDMYTEEESRIRTRREATDPDDTEQDEESSEVTYSCNPDTEWTPCSRTCGFGNSIRIIYEKETCIPKAEKRLCMIRPCKGQYPSANYTVRKATPVCNRLMSWSHPLPLRLRDCVTSRPLLPKFCGLCSDGRLCTPSLSQTRTMVFNCPQPKRKVTRQLMWVHRCECGGKKGKKGKKKNRDGAKKPRKEVTNEVVGDEK